MRSCGILLHISSLPGMGGVGTLGREARQFVDFLQSAGQRWWQILPLTPPARGNSPYSSYSVFAGNPAFISLFDLEEQGLLSYWTKRFLPKHTGERANFGFCDKVQIPLLRQSFSVGYGKFGEEMAAFRQEQAFWLEDYALFMALKGKLKNKPVQGWPGELRRREPAAIECAKTELADEINFWVWTQYLFHQQWRELKDYANGRNVGIIGDMPIYVDIDSADLWAHPEVFQLDHKLRPTAVAGVPPDAFSDDGQLWGNPLYDWEHLASTGYDWWLRRLSHGAQLYDRIRIDHFRALDEYYAAPAGSETAREGAWRPGPGLPFLNRVKQALPECDLIAEDLGWGTETVRLLLDQSGLPGMRVLQFAFTPREGSEHLPHNFVANCVAYTGTHDNDTSAGWLKSIPQQESDYAKTYLQLNRREGYCWGMIRALYGSVADTVITPLQDVLELDSRARMNTPAVPQGNWSWRMSSTMLTGRVAEKLSDLARLYDRIPTQQPESSKEDSDRL